MKSNSKSIFGIYQKWEAAENGVLELQKAGFTKKDISLLVHAENMNKDAFAPEKHTKTQKGIAAGIAGGAIVGGSLGLLAGLGSLAVPGVGPLFAVGPILASLTGIGMGGAAGGIVGAFIGVGIPEHKANYLREVVQNGGILVAVHVEDPATKREVYQILQDTGATEISSSEYEAISSIDDISPSFAARGMSPKEDLLSRKQF